MEQVTQRRGRGTLGWIVRFAGKRKGNYIASMIYRTFVEGRQEAASWKLSQVGT